LPVGSGTLASSFISHTDIAFRRCGSIMPILRRDVPLIWEGMVSTSGSIDLGTVYQGFGHDCVTISSIAKLIPKNKLQPVWINVSRMKEE